MTNDLENLELYKVFVDTVMANEARRQQINSIYISLFSAGIVAFGTVESMEPILFSSLALPLSIVWYLQVRYLKDLASAKFRVIIDLEKEFSRKPFSEEWVHMGNEPGKPSRRQFPLSRLELWIPSALGSVAAVHIVVWLIIFLNAQQI